MIDNITQALELKTTPAPRSQGIPIANSSQWVAGQPCDWVAAQKLGARICYWSTSHNYPSALPRPIILRREYKNTREEATTFKRINTIPKTLLSPPSNT